jgi:hypothetical protein
MMTRVYKHLEGTKDWKPGHHVDHHLGRLLMQGNSAVYSPESWLIGQNEGKSDVNGRDVPTRFWDNIKPAQPIAQPITQPIATDFVAIIGLHRSGSSILATCLRKLGLWLGRDMVGCEEEGGGEARGLRDLCEGWLRFPGLTYGHRPQAELRLTRFIYTKCAEAAKQGIIAGGKYPMLCTMGDMLQKTCGTRLKVIHIDRPIEESIASIIRREKRRDPKILEAHQRQLLAKKLEFLASVDHLTIQYSDLIAQPVVELQRACQFAGMSVSQATLEAIAGMIKPEKRHFG